VKPPFDSVLIANRGEIAVRIARTLRAMRIRSVLACHPIDAREPAARAVDDVRWLAGDDPLRAHLDGEQIVALAREAGAAAVHPGYGFLSENADFAELVRASGLAFVGPPASAIRAMGDKIAARALAAAHGVRTADAVLEAGDRTAFVDRARALGAPLIVKAAAGGGGKAMQIVRAIDELPGAIARCRAEAKRFFADDRVYVERHVERPRHIEVQVLADRHGTCLHLFDRECSIQRRFQKLVEEAPAPRLPDAVRTAMRDQALSLSRAVGYEGAGTVEFIVTPDDDFAFLEMNTRLQVEHPVTECITGLDLVEQQIRIAAGESIAFAQRDVRARGCAIELRVCAEEPEADFRPATGSVLALRRPTREGVRLDAGVDAGSQVSASFDSLLAKLVAHDDTRDGAIARAIAGLRELALLGVATNARFLERVLDHPAFRAADLHTGFASEHAAQLRDALPDEDLRAVVAAAALAHRPLRDAVDAVPPLARAIGEWRNER